MKMDVFTDGGDKVPSGDSLYAKAKHAQLIEKNPSKALVLFWSAINSGDRIDSALKDMAVVMKQLKRSNEAIEAIKSLRHLCSSDSQDSLDNVLLELYKGSRRLEEQIEVLQLKLKRIEEGNIVGSKKLKLGRRQGKKVPITVEQEYARLLGNLAWAYLQQNDYKTAEQHYSKALSIETNRNNQCNLAICLMHTNRKAEAKVLLKTVRASCTRGRMDEFCGRSLKRASKLLAELENQADKSSLHSGKENCCDNAGFNLHKKPYKSITNKTKRAGADHTMDLFKKSNSLKRTYTASVEILGVPDSPISQPSSPIVLSAHSDEPEQHGSVLQSNRDEQEQHGGVLQSRKIPEAKNYEAVHPSQVIAETASQPVAEKDSECTPHNTASFPTTLLLSFFKLLRNMLHNYCEIQVNWFKV